MGIITGICVLAVLSSETAAHLSLRTSSLKSEDERTAVEKSYYLVESMGRGSTQLGWQRMFMKRFKLDKCQGIQDTEYRLEVPNQLYTKSAHKF